jgi:hypothetical protein
MGLMAENDGTFVSEISASVPEAQSKASTSRFELPSALHTIALSTAIAALTGVSACIGESLEIGKRQALGLYALSTDQMGQREVFNGLSVIAQVLVDGLFLVVLARIAYLAFRWTVRKTGLQHQIRVPSFIRGHLWLLALLVVTVDAGFLGATITELSSHVEGLLFKNLTEIGDVWTQVIFEEHLETAAFYTLIYSGLLALLICLCWWLVMKGVDNPLRKGIVSIFGLLFVFASLLGFAFLTGAVSTVKEYPVVAISSPSGMIGGKGTVPILLGQDDKMFAVLVVMTGAKSDEIHKMLMYVPRSEVKSMAVSQLYALYKIDKYDDLQRLEEEMNKRTQ